jgi:hypothetical protein
VLSNLQEAVEERLARVLERDLVYEQVGRFVFEEETGFA